MARRKHTHCAVCATVVFARFLEVQWRDDGVGPWWWIGGWMCGSCRAGFVNLVGGIGQSILALDG